MTAHTLLLRQLLNELRLKNIKHPDIEASKQFKEKTGRWPTYQEQWDASKLYD